MSAIRMDQAIIEMLVDDEEQELMVVIHGCFLNEYGVYVGKE